MHAFLRTVVGVQTDGSAFIAAAPKRLANDTPLTNNSTPALLSSTTTTLLAAGFPIMDTGAAFPGAGTNLNTDYTSASILVTPLGEGITYRIVGMGVRVRYIGPLLSEAGIAHCVIEPDHYTLSGLTISQIGQLETYFNMPVTQTDWITLTYTPVTTEEFQYQPDPTLNPGANVGRVTNQHYIGMAFTGLPPGNNLAVEMVVHYEALGRLVRGKTSTPSDVVGTGIVLGAMNANTQKENQEPNTTVKNLLSAVMPTITTDSIGQVASAAINLL